MSSRFIRNSTESPNLLKRLLGHLPLPLKRHLLYLRKFKRWGNFRTPTLFSEKMQWRIINDRRDRLRHTCDKLASKELAITLAAKENLTLHVANVIAFHETGDQMFRNLQGLSERGVLPPRWVLKPNASSSRALLIDGAIDWELIRTTLRAWSHQSKFTGSGLHWIWPYTTAKKGFLAEDWVGTTATPPIEVAACMVGGKLAFWTVQRWDSDGLRRNHYNAQGKVVSGWNSTRSSELDISAPERFIQEVLPYLYALSAGWDLIRVDLYYEGGKVWLGELTPFPAEGLEASENAKEFDMAVGALWQLPPLESVREGNP